MRSQKRVVVGLGTCGISAGAREVYSAFKNQLRKSGLDIGLGQTGCIGLCHREVIVDIYDDDAKRTYENVTTDMVPRIVQEDLIDQEPVEEWLLETEIAIPQRRIVLRNCGIIDPENISEYIDREGYKGLERVLTEMSPSKVISLIKEAGLRDRDRRGQQTGFKWESVSQASGDKKYVVCVADACDPGARPDRSILEGDPHSVIEGMIIAGYAIGACDGILYYPSDYRLAGTRSAIALRQAKERGFLGDGLASGVSFNIALRESPGALIGAEETALIASIEGRCAVPSDRSPVISGLWDCPTVVNNVETLANVAWIALNGADAYSGTKVFALAGKIARSGLVEVPIGTTLREVVFGLGGGVPDASKLKAVQVGGVTGCCLPESELATQVEYESLASSGASMDFGGIVVADQSTCVVALSKFFMDFARKASCGKCGSCRIGAAKILAILTRITDGEGETGDLDEIAAIAMDMKANSMCRLGPAISNQALSTLKHFRAEFLEHIEKKHCPAASCWKLTVFTVDVGACTGCGACKKSCLSGAITGKKREIYRIDQATCTKCGNCARACEFGAVVNV